MVTSYIAAKHADELTWHKEGCLLPMNTGDGGVPLGDAPPPPDAQDADVECFSSADSQTPLDDSLTSCKLLPFIN